MRSTHAAPRAAARVGGAGRILSDEEVGRFVEEQLAVIDAEGRSV